MWTDHGGEPSIRLPSSVNNTATNERSEAVSNQDEGVTH